MERPGWTDHLGRQITSRGPDEGVYDQSQGIKEYLLGFCFATVISELPFLIELDRGEPRPRATRVGVPLLYIDYYYIILFSRGQMQPRPAVQA